MFSRATTWTTTATKRESAVAVVYPRVETFSGMLHLQLCAINGGSPSKQINFDRRYGP
jgi:hypothetical protein